MAWFTQVLSRYPEMGIYLALGLGFWLGRVRIRGFVLGGVAGSLLAGLVLGAWFAVPVSATAKSVAFLLFLFGIGYEVGPSFTAMKGLGWRLAALGVFMPMVGLVTAWAVARAASLDAGLAAGMLSGALTQSPAMGTATEALHALPMDDATRDVLLAHVGIAGTLCYLFGAIGLILMCTAIGPRLLGIDLRSASRELESEYGVARRSQAVQAAWQPFETRAYRVSEGTAIEGRRVEEAERLVAGSRLFVHRIRRQGELLEPAPGMTIQAGDLLAIGGRREVLVNVIGERAVEVEDRELLEIPVASYEVFVSQTRWAGATLEQIAASDDMRAVFLRRILRRGQEIPIGARTTIQRGDLLLLVGHERAVLRAASGLGEVILPTETTDFVVVGLAVFLGSLAGVVLAVPVGHVTLSLGTSVGVLLAGIVTGQVRARRPLFGRIPDGAVKLMQTFGLASFAAMVGLGAGPHFISAVRASGLALPLGGAVVTLMPPLLALWFGRRVLGLHPVLLLGAICGGQTSTTALSALQEKSGSSIAVLGYSGAVPVAHVFLTTWGAVMVLLFY